jgi:RNA polymerase sigma-70 factor (family 1)
MSFKDHSSDNNLIIGLKRNSHDSFRLLYNLYSKPLFQFSVRYLKSTEAAEDVVQEVFSKIWKNRKELKTDTSFKSYLYTIALNSIRKQFNKLSRFNEVRHDLLFDFSQNKPEFDNRDDFESLLAKLDELINKMPEKRKQVFIKKKLEEKSLKEIAVELDITAKTVEYHITEAMKFLKKEFESLQIKGMIFFYLFVKK